MLRPLKGPDLCHHPTFLVSRSPWTFPLCPKTCCLSCLWANCSQTQNKTIKTLHDAANTLLSYFILSYKTYFLNYYSFPPLSHHLVWPSAFSLLKLPSQPSPNHWIQQPFLSPVSQPSCNNWWDLLPHKNCSACCPRSASLSNCHVSAFAGFFSYTFHLHYTPTVLHSALRVFPHSPALAPFLLFHRLGTPPQALCLNFQTAASLLATSPSPLHLPFPARKMSICLFPPHLQLTVLCIKSIFSFLIFPLWLMKGMIILWTTKARTSEASLASSLPKAHHRRGSADGPRSGDRRCECLSWLFTSAGDPGPVRGLRHPRHGLCSLQGKAYVKGTGGDHWQATMTMTGEESQWPQRRSQPLAPRTSHTHFTLSHVSRNAEGSLQVFINLNQGNLNQSPNSRPSYIAMCFSLLAF